MGRFVHVATSLICLSLIATACGDDDSGSAVQPTATATATAGAGATASSAQQASSDFTLAKPLRLALMWEIPGESSFAVPDFENGAGMALDEVNAAGGVGGHPVEFERFPSPPLDLQGLTTNFLRARDYKPSAMIGMGGASILGLTNRINEAKIPIVYLGVNNDVRLGAASGSDWIFHAFTADESTATAAVKFARETLKASNIALLHTNESFGQGGSDTAKRVLNDAGLKPCIERGYAPDATDLTEPVLAAKSCDAVINWGYPNPIAVQLNQFAQNQITIPTVTNGSASVVVDAGLAKGDAISNMYGSETCNPDDSRPVVQDFVQRFTQRFGAAPNPNSRTAFDAVSVVIEAAKVAKSSDPDAIRQALGTLQYTNGICSPDYHSDGAHVLQHQTVVISYVGGVRKVVSTIVAPDQARLAG
jgi:branched-chain amino acid transport system substrate-binding protein